MAERAVCRWINIVTGAGLVTCLLMVPILWAQPLEFAARHGVVVYGIPSFLFLVGTTAAAAGTAILARRGLSTRCVLRCLLWDILLTFAPLLLLIVVGFLAFSLMVFALPILPVAGRCLQWCGALLLGHLTGWALASGHASRRVRQGE